MCCPGGDWAPAGVIAIEDRESNASAALRRNDRDRFIGRISLSSSRASISLRRPEMVGEVLEGTDLGCWDGPGRVIDAAHWPHAAG